MITVSHLHKNFGRFKALDDVNVNFENGSGVALIGPNGSGKTTLIKCILGMVLPDKGDIMVNGQDVRNNWKYRQSVGYMPQNGQFPEHMTVGQVLDMMRDIRRAEREDLDLLKAFRITDILDKRMRTLSGGMTQKVNATIAFMFDPKVLILDEPTAGLDPVASEILKEKIMSVRSDGKHVLITSHVLSELEDLVTDVTFIQDGKIRFNKSILQLKSDTNTNSLSKAIAHIMK